MHTFETPIYNTTTTTTTSSSSRTATTKRAKTWRYCVIFTYVYVFVSCNLCFIKSIQISSSRVELISCLHREEKICLSFEKYIIHLQQKKRDMQKTTNRNRLIFVTKQRHLRYSVWRMKQVTCVTIRHINLIDRPPKIQHSRSVANYKQQQQQRRTEKNERVREIEREREKKHRHIHKYFVQCNTCN